MGQIIYHSNLTTMTQNTNRQENDNNDSEDLGQSSSIDIMRKFQLLLTLMASPITDETGSRKSVLAGLFTIFMFGTVIGLITPKNEALTPPYQTVSAAIGYIYFMAWRWVKNIAVLNNSRIYLFKTLECQPS